MKPRGPGSELGLSLALKPSPRAPPLSAGKREKRAQSKRAHQFWLGWQLRCRENPIVLHCHSRVLIGPIRDGHCSEFCRLLQRDYSLTIQNCSQVRLAGSELKRSKEINDHLVYLSSETAGYTAQRLHCLPSESIVQRFSKHLSSRIGVDVKVLQVFNIL